MPRRSRYPGNKNAPQGRGRRPGRAKPPAESPSAPVESRQPVTQKAEPSLPASPITVQKDFTPPPYILREIKRTAIIAGLLLTILIILSIVL